MLWRPARSRDRLGSGRTKLGVGFSASPKKEGGMGFLFRRRSPFGVRLGGSRSSLATSGLYLRLAQRNTDYGAQIVSHDAVAAGEIERPAGIGEHKFGVGFERILKNGVRHGLVVQQRLAFGVASGSEAQVAVLAFHEDVTPLGAGELQSCLQQSDQDLIEHTGGVELARGLQKKSEFFEVGGF